MERESFENEEIARVLNENFIPIKIDRYLLLLSCGADKV